MAAGDISERAYEATQAMLRRTSNAPMTGEISRLVEEFALAFGREVALKLVADPSDLYVMEAVKNAVSRAAKGEP